MLMYYVEVITTGKREVAFYSEDFDTIEEAQEYASWQRNLGYTARIKRSN